jgi:hypothetical protein
MARREEEKKRSVLQYVSIFRRRFTPTSDKRWYLETIFFLNLRNKKLDPSAGRLAGGRRESARTADCAMRPDTSGRHQFLDIPATARGTFGRRIIGGQSQFFKTMAAGFALVFVNRHD